jgi:parafibromin
LEPIIIVPPGFGTLLNMLNVKQFLESGSFVTTEEARSKGAKKVGHLEITRKAASGGSKKSWKLTVIDSVDRLTTEDWDRVVAVFAGGMSWQFTGWQWHNPVELFSKVRGYHVKYEGEETPTLVSQWNVRVLPVRMSIVTPT